MGKNVGNKYNRIVPRILKKCIQINTKKIIGTPIQMGKGYVQAAV